VFAAIKLPSLELLIADYRLIRTSRQAPTGNWPSATGNVPFRNIWQDRRESNPQPPVLETGALPIELLSFTTDARNW
jgi:hypothetical protein